MSLYPQFKADVDASLSAEQRVGIVHKLEALDGIVSVKFNKEATKVLVTYNGYAAKQEAQKIPGLHNVQNKHSL